MKQHNIWVAFSLITHEIFVDREGRSNKRAWNTKKSLVKAIRRNGRTPHGYHFKHIEISKDNFSVASSYI